MSGNLVSVACGMILEMTDALTLSEIAGALDTLADLMISDRTDELAGYNASFWRDAALVLRRLARPAISRRRP